MPNNENCENCLIFEPQRFPSGFLLFLFEISGNNENNATLYLINHWVNCNVYTQSRKTIQQRLMVI